MWVFDAGLLQVFRHTQNTDSLQERTGISGETERLCESSGEFGVLTTMFSFAFSCAIVLVQSTAPVMDQAYSEAVSFGSSHIK